MSTPESTAAPQTEPQQPDSPQPGQQPGLYRRFYNWVLHWAYTPYAQPALGTMSFAESSFFPIPPDVLLIPMCLGDRKRALRFALLCSITSVLGGILGYFLGKWFWNMGLDQICFDWIPGFSEDKYEQIKGWYENYSFWIVFIAGFSPIPYKIFTITGGVFAINFPMFVIASAVSRSARFFLVAGLLYVWGEPIRKFIDERLGLVSVVFCALLVGGFYLIKVVLH